MHVACKTAIKTSMTVLVRFSSIRTNQTNLQLNSSFSGPNNNADERRSSDGGGGVHGSAAASPARSKPHLDRNAFGLINYPIFKEVAFRIVFFCQKSSNADLLASVASVDKNPCYSGTDYSGTTQSPPLKPQL